MGNRGSSSHAAARVFGRMPNYPSFRMFPSQMAAENYHKANNFDMAKWQNALTNEERSGIYAYTGMWYSDMNTNLREGYASSGQIKYYIDGATTGLGKWSAAEDVVTFRGSNLHWTANLLGGTEDQMSNAAFLRGKIGKTVVDKGFMSTGTHKDSAWSADVDYTVFVRKGTKGMYVDPISANSGEYEFLFNRDTSFKVHMIKTDSSGRISELVLEAYKSKH